MSIASLVQVRPLLLPPFPEIMLCNINCPQPLSRTAPPARMLRSPRLGDSVQDSRSCRKIDRSWGRATAAAGEESPQQRGKNHRSSWGRVTATAGEESPQQLGGAAG
eukprot:gene18652-biopygen12973